MPWASSDFTIINDDGLLHRGQEKLPRFHGLEHPCVTVLFWNTYTGYLQSPRMASASGLGLVGSLTDDGSFGAQRH